MMDCLYAECIPCITDCVMAELEKLGPKYRVALKVAKVCGEKGKQRVNIPCTPKTNTHLLTVSVADELNTD